MTPSDLLVDLVLRAPLFDQRGCGRTAAGDAAMKKSCGPW